MTESTPLAVEPSPPEPPRSPLAGAPTTGGQAMRPWWTWLALALAGGAVFVAWSSREEQRRLEQTLVKRLSEAQTQVAESRTWARTAEDQAREAQAKVSLLEQRVTEASAQRTQLEGLMLSLSRTRDDNVLTELESMVRIANQQSTLTGRHEPLVAVLQQVDERLAALPAGRGAGVRRAVGRDLERLHGVASVDAAALATRLDELLREAGELPLVMPSQAGGLRDAALANMPGVAVAPNAQPTSTASMPSKTSTEPNAATPQDWRSVVAQTWVQWKAAVSQELRSLIRVTRINNPQAALLSPEQGYFARENLRLRLLSARLAVMSRQTEVALGDLRAARGIVQSHFDGQTARVQRMLASLDQWMAAVKPHTTLTADDTLAALQAAAAVSAATPRRP